ncbi:MAG: hypothetical protein WD995_11125 [Gemmatimonadota bacterium]
MAAALTLAGCDPGVTDPPIDPVATGPAGEAEFTVVGMGLVSDRSTSDLWAHGSVAYTGTRNCEGSVCGNRLYAWDIGDPSNIVLTDSVLVDATRVNDVKISEDGGLAVLTHEGAADGLNGITLLDMTDPLHPTVITRYVGDCSTPTTPSCLGGGIHNVWIDGGFVYAVEEDGGLHILDVSDPREPQEVALFHAGSSHPHDVLVRDGLAFVSHWDAGLVIVDVGNGMRGGSPANPVEVSRIEIADGAMHNAWYWPERGYVFVGQESYEEPAGRMSVVDVSDLTAPVTVAEYAVEGSPPHNFWLDEDRGILYAAWYWKGLHAIDVSGDLEGDLAGQGRLYASIRPRGPRGAASIWAPQLHEGLIFASDKVNGLWALRFTVE